jgi:hypothetical protein
VQRVGSQFEDATELSRSGGWPKRELLHQGRALRCDEGLEFRVKGGEVRMSRDGVERVVVTVVSLVFPDVHCSC